MTSRVGTGSLDLRWTLPAWSLPTRASPHIFGYLKGRRTATVPTSSSASIAFLDHRFFVCCGILAWLSVQSTLGLFALDSLSWRPRVHSNVGPSRSSVTGFPERDPLSCLAMLGFNMVFDAYLKCFAPESIPLAFADNLQLVSSTAALLRQGILVMETFMEAWDLSLDPAKCYTWSSHASQRSVLRAFGHRWP